MMYKTLKTLAVIGLLTATSSLSFGASSYTYKEVTYTDAPVGSVSSVSVDLSKSDGLQKMKDLTTDLNNGTLKAKLNGRGLAITIMRRNDNKPSKEELSALSALATAMKSTDIKLTSFIHHNSNSKPEVFEQFVDALSGHHLELLQVTGLEFKDAALKKLSLHLGNQKIKLVDGRGKVTLSLEGEFTPERVRDVVNALETAKYKKIKVEITSRSSKMKNKVDELNKWAKGRVGDVTIK